MSPSNHPLLQAPGQVTAKLRALPWVARNMVMDLRYGAILSGTIKTRYSGSSNVANSQYSALPPIFEGRIGPDDVLVDVGCGKGRVINWWLSRGLRNRIVGIELDPQVASATARRLRRFPNASVVNEDATEWLPDDATIVYMYSPFSRDVMARFKEHVAQRFAGKGLTMLYLNPAFVEVFEDDPRFATEVSELPILDPRIEGRQRRLAVVRLAPA